jgi:tight adherence protein C
MILNQTLMFEAGLFATSVLLIYSLSGLLLRSGADPVLQRLRAEARGARPSHGRSDQPGRGLGPLITRVGVAASKPFMPNRPENQSELRRQLAYAGFYGPTFARVLVGMKLVMMGVGAAGGLTFGWLIGDGTTRSLLATAAALLGYLAPGLWLKLQIRRRRDALERALPDALDLMVVCVESGLTIDAAIQRVGHEIAMVHPDISKELGITHMETRVGVPRVEALRNLGTRTGSASLKSLAAVLVQTERFGTGIAQALRVHSESLRTKRQHRAEEQAAKTSVKLAFPVVLFIFPTLLLVLGGPAFILFFKSPLFTR